MSINMQKSLFKEIIYFFIIFFYKHPNNSIFGLFSREKIKQSLKNLAFKQQL
jgi:hypothetical protein